MNIFVTGASGFIGSYFCKEALKRGHSILALARTRHQGLPSGVQTALGCIQETPWRQVADFKPDAALHLAWIAEPGTYLNSPDNAIWLEQSRSWFQHLFELGIAHVCGTGTCIEYAPSQVPLNEDRSPLAPQHPYSRAKVQLFKWLAQNSPSDWAWFRIFYPYGVNEHTARIASLLIRRLLQGHEVVLKTPLSIKDYIHVDDVASALCSSMEKRLTGAVNIGTGTGVSIQALAEMIAAQIEADPALIRSSDSHHLDEMPHVVADNAKLKSTGWTPSTLLPAGLRRLADKINATL